MQRTNIFEFEWARDAEGYELHTPGKKAMDVIFNTTVIRGKGGALKAYYPRAFPDMHRIFAALPDDAGEILKFISAYGLLGLDPNGKEESLGDIRAAKKELREVLIAVDSFVDLDNSFRRAQIDMRERYKGPKPGEARQIAAGHFNNWAGKYLSQFRVVLRSESGDERAKVGLSVVPSTLISSMWLSAAEELAEGPKYRACVVCQTPIPIGEGGGRRDKQTCSVNCRKKLSLQNKAKRLTKVRRAKR